MSPFKLDQSHIGKKVTQDHWEPGDYLLVTWVNDEPDWDGYCYVSGTQPDGFTTVLGAADEAIWEFWKGNEDAIQTD